MQRSAMRRPFRRAPHTIAKSLTVNRAIFLVRAFGSIMSDQVEGPVFLYCVILLYESETNLAFGSRCCYSFSPFFLVTH